MPLRRVVIGLTVVAATVGATAIRRPAAPVTLVLGVDRPGASISKTMVGVFFEDINFAADGGLYPERVKNRSFEFPDPLMGWRRAMRAARARSPCGRTRRESARTRTTCASRHRSAGQYGVSNEGYRGIGVRKAGMRTCSPPRAPRRERAARAPRGVRERRGRSRYGRRDVDGLGVDMGAHSVHARPTRPELRGRLARVPSTARARSTWTWCRCFPAETWENRENGLRADLGAAAQGHASRASSASPAAASSRGGISRAAISGRRRSATRPSAR